MSDLNAIYELTPEDSDLLFSNHINEQHIEIHEYNKLRWLRIDGSYVQSVMHIDRPDHLISPINRAMCLALIFPEQNKNLLNIGFGGGAFERCFLSKLPDMNIDSVESNEIVIHLARDYFHIAADYPVYHSQADSYLKEVDETYDLILCDIFDEEVHPECLYQEQFYVNAARNLAMDGVLSLNLTPDDEKDMIRLLKTLRKVFPYTNLLTFKEHKNIIVFAYKQKITETEILEKRCKALEKKLNVDLLNNLHTLRNIPPATDSTL